MGITLIIRRCRISEKIGGKGRIIIMQNCGSYKKIGEALWNFVMYSKISP